MRFSLAYDSRECRLMAIYLGNAISIGLSWGKVQRGGITCDEILFVSSCVIALLQNRIAKILGSLSHVNIKIRKWHVPACVWQLFLSLLRFFFFFLFTLDFTRSRNRLSLESANEAIILSRRNTQTGSRLRDKITNTSYYLHLSVCIYNLYTNFFY